MDDKTRDIVIDATSDLDLAELEIINALEWSENWTEVSDLLKEALKYLNRATELLEYEFGL